MMLTLLVFGYCEGRRSARELETACRRDVAYQAICGGWSLIMPPSPGSG